MEIPRSPKNFAFIVFLPLVSVRYPRAVGTSSRSQFLPFAAAEIGVTQRAIRAELARRSLHDGVAKFEHVSAVGDVECLLRVLLNKQDCYAAIAMRPRDHCKNFIGQPRAQPERGLIEHHD